MGRKRVPVDTSGYSGRIAARVRELREAQGLTVDKLATKANVDLKSLYAYENGSRTIPPDLYPRLARALGCKSANEFFPPLK